jgi:two-component system chemotaxis sensor kinase CheA
VNEVDEIVQEFLVESHENLDQLDRDLVALEQDPNSRPLIGSIFRTIHTIKGTSGFLAFGHLESVTHVGESLLSRLRDGALELTPERTSALLEMVDAVRGLLAEIEESGTEGSPNHADLIAKLGRLQEAPVAAAVGAVGASAAAPAAAAPAAVEPTPAPQPEAVTPVAEAKPEPVPAATPAPASTEPLLGEVLVGAAAVSPDDRDLALMAQDAGDDRPIGEILVAHGSAKKTQVEQALTTQAEGKRSVAESSIRVDVDLLDSLMRLVGELVLTRNQVVSHAAGMADATLLRVSQRLNLVASELQEGVMKTRMQPIDNVWNKLPRVVRDLGVTCGKSVRLEMEGRETELDKTILEAIKDPLTHLVRNAMDHGVETPEARTAVGKSRDGVLRLHAFHEGGHVIIEVTDDGAGIDTEKIAAKALSRGLVTKEQLASYTDRELLNLIFLPGFSTAAAVTNVSGRGVGMDVVKTNIERIGGTVDISSRLGVGTTFRVKIPLTLAIIPALVITSAGDRYAIPQVNLLELVRLDSEQSKRSIEHIHGVPVYRLRGELLPLVYLNDQLGVSKNKPATAEGDESAVDTEDSADTTFVVVLQAEDRQFGLVVDEVNDTEEIVVKPLSKQLKGIGAFAGATIMGDGYVALILDVLAVAQRAHVLNGARERVKDDVKNVQTVVDERESLLIVGLSDGRRVAIPLAMVTRLEEFSPTLIERVGTREVVQYRDHILPLVRVADVLGAYGDTDPDATLRVVVYSEGGRSVGLVVDSILDTVEEVLTAQSDLEAAGVTGSAVVSNKITGLLDVQQAILTADPYFYRRSAEELVGATGTKG